METRRSGQRWRELIDKLRGSSVRPWAILATMAMIGLVSWLDVATGPGREPAALYDIPILFSAVAFGMTGALITSAAATTTYHLTLWHHLVVYSIADVSQTALFFFLGLVVARLVTEYQRACDLHTELQQLNVQLERRIAEAVAAECEAQQKLRDSQRLKILGEAAAQIAHEIKNPLVSIGGFARRLQKQIPDEHPGRVGLRVIAEEVAKLEGLLQDLLQFARPTCCVKRPIEVTALINDVLALAQHPAEQFNVRLVQRCPDSPLTIMGDADQLKRALFNIVLNGVQAMPDGGELTIIVSADSNHGAPTVSITMQDTGPGIPPEHLSLIFDPFFTTKPGGTGLGLPLVKKTVEAHGGTLRVESTPEFGTSVTVWLFADHPPK